MLPTMFGNFSAAKQLAEFMNTTYKNQPNIKAYITKIINETLFILNKLNDISDRRLRSYFYNLHRRSTLNRIDDWFKDNNTHKQLYTFTRNVLTAHLRKFNGLRK